MEHISIYQLYKHPPQDGAEVFVCGWARTVRDSKSIGFIEMNDGSSFRNLQVVFEQEKLGNFAQVARCGVGTALRVAGRVVLTPGAQQPLEINATAIEVAGGVDADYPLQKKRHSVEFLRTLPHLRARTNTFAAVFRLRSTAAYAIHKFFNQNGFVYVHTPVITGSDAEGAGEMFRVTTLPPCAPTLPDGTPDWTQDFFGRQANLTVSGQLEAEGMALAFGKVYTFGPTFRAENSNTPRHAAEFWMIEPEIAFANLADDMDLAEAMMKFIVRYVLKHCGDELAFFNKFYDTTLLQRLNALATSDFERVAYTAAIEQLEKNNAQFQFKAEWGCDLQTEHERYLTERVYSKPVFVTDYPKDIKSFYMRQNTDGKTVAATDMLVPGVGELIGGSQREERGDVLQARMQELGMDLDEYRWFLDLRRFGSAPHAGFGLGFERLVMYLSGIPNIRDVQLYPRVAGGL